MQAFRLERGRGLAGLALHETGLPSLGPRDVRVAVQAVSLNFRDLEIVRGGNRGDAPLTPCSDGAGIVSEVGSAVTDWRIGDRVAASFFPHWSDGPATDAKIAGSLGNRGPGMLAESVVLPDHALFAIPASLGFNEASTLPCAGLVAWNALFATGGARPGDTVLALGTGGVSVWALQLAQAAGVRVLITSSDDRKLALARQAGADGTINYREHPDWHEQVLQLTQGRGADVVLETAGRETLARSMQAARRGGCVAVVGGTSGWDAKIDVETLMFKGLRVAGVLVGSRAMAQDLVRFVEHRRVRPLIDRVFPFAQAVAAFDYLGSASHVGKVVVEVAAA